MSKAGCHGLQVLFFVSPGDQMKGWLGTERQEAQGSGLSPGVQVCEAPRGHTVPTSSRPTRALPWANEKAGVIITTSTRRPCPSVQGNYLAAVVGVAHGEPPSRAPGGGLHLHTSPGAPAALHSPLHRRYQVA